MAARRARVIGTAKEWARGYLNEHHTELATRIRDRLMTRRRAKTMENRVASLERAVYRGISADQSIHDWEISIHSQNGEDGILLNLFSRIGAESRRFFEFGCGPGLECN